MTVGFLSGATGGPTDYTAPAAFVNYWRTWLPETLNFTATASSAVVQFSVNQSFDVGLDAVSVSAVSSVPEPTALALLGSGILGLGLARLRRR
jgi:hypothetical protein